jgi:hypothetical protein
MGVKGDRKVALFMFVRHVRIRRQERKGRRFRLLQRENWKNAGVSCYFALPGRDAAIRNAGSGDGNDCQHRPFLSGHVDSMRYWNAAHSREYEMTKVIYAIVEHDGGWAYKLTDVFSEAFPNREMAVAAAKAAAAEQQVGGEDEEISFQDQSGQWHFEHADGGDRPEAVVEDQ